MTSTELLRSSVGGLGGLTTEALERATGSPEIKGNSIRLQFDGPVTFEAWLEAIAGAKRYVHFENYILRNDPVGRAFRDVLLEKARQGVEVRVLYDWVGCWATPRRYWRPFHRAGVEVRAFNRPSVGDPYGVFQRDHRKLVVVDGEVAFAGGFCIGQEWAAIPAQSSITVIRVMPSSTPRAGVEMRPWRTMNTLKPGPSVTLPASSTSTAVSPPRS